MRRTILLLAIVLAASAIQIETYLNATPQECIEAKCPNQWAACQKDSKCVPALQECEKKCGSKTSCWSLCLPSKGSQAAIDVAKCASANGCVGMIPSTALAVATPQECIEAKCPNQWAACQKDPVRPQLMLPSVPKLRDATRLRPWPLSLVLRSAS